MSKAGGLFVDDQLGRKPAKVIISVSGGWVFSTGGGGGGEGGLNSIT